MPELVRFLRYAALPLLFLGLVLSFILLYRFLNVPSFEEFLEIIKRYYALYGFWFVFVGALMEGLLLINWYLPGSMVIVFGVVFTQGDPWRAVITVALVILAFFITAIINYALGRYGWYRLLSSLGLEAPLAKIKRRVEKHGLSVIFITYLHPNIGALTATSAGILNISFGRFVAYSLVALVAWNSVWGVVTYLAGPILLEAMNFKVVLTVIAVWLVFLLVKFWWEKRNRTVLGRIA